MPAWVMGTLVGDVSDSHCKKCNAKKNDGILSFRTLYFYVLLTTYLLAAELSSCQGI